MGPQEMLDRAEVKNKWQLTPLKNFKSPRLTERMWRTALVVLITSVIYEYPLGGRNPCFALIGAVYGVGSQFEEGFHNGINRVIGTLVGGLLVIPFHRLYTSQPFGIPDWIWLVTGLCLVLWCNFALGCRFCNSAWNRHLFRCYVYSRKRKGFSIHNRKNRTMREKERENFGTDDDKNFSAIVSKIKDKHL